VAWISLHQVAVRQGIAHYVNQYEQVAIVRKCIAGSL
jgi:hypothetical protein